MIGFIVDAWEDGWPGRLVLLLCIAVIVGLPTGIYALVQIEREWKSFAIAHSCKVVGKVSGNVSTGFATTFSNGKVGYGPVVVNTPSKTGYACDDGITYWR
jgi:hypothetical protein